MIQKFNELSMNKLCELICENKKTLIIYHVNSDADAVGSAFALKELLRVMDIPSYCVCADEVPERLQFLMDGTQGSVLLEEGLRLDYERIISVDSASPSRLGDLFYRLHKDIDIMIDHHANGTQYADYYIDANAAATGEIIYTIAKKLRNMGKIKEIPERVINCVYAAISSDTGGFRFANATPATYRLAAELIEAGVNSADINRQLFDSKSFLQLKAEGIATQNLCVHYDGRVASTLFPYSAKRDLGVKDEELETLIDIPRSVLGADIAFVVKQPSEEKTYRVSMRSSSDKYDVAKICAVFGGGGHKRAAGCTINASDIEDAEQMILDEIAKIK